jgi:diguanylate cyclase (GGDEF)-like protein/hemerythrin-like metal-binding protein
MFDIRTTFLLIIVVNFSLGLTILSAAASERESGLYKVSFANISHGSGYLFFIISSLYFKNLFEWMGEVFIAISIVVWYGALCQFLKIKQPVILLVAVVIYNSTISWIFVDEKDSRIIFNSISIILIETIFLHTLLSKRKSINGRGKFLVLASVFINLIILLYREEFSIFGGTVKYLFDRGPSQSVLYVSVLTTLICFSLGFVLMAKERTDYLNKELILKDGLTGLWNRRRLDEVGKSEIARHIRYGTPASLALIDIDNFKKINDQHGHNVGDEILTKVSASCAKILRDTDILGRWGGEEFMVIFPGTSMSDLMRAAEQLRTVIHEIEIEPGRKISASIGLSLCLSSDTWESWIERADVALYQAKSLGKNIAQLDIPVTHEQNYSLIKWGGEFETGYQDIDAEHYNLISLINNWIKVSKENCTKNFLFEHLDVIRREICSHFDREDIFIADKNEILSAPHRGMHTHLIQRLDFLIESFKKEVIPLETISQFVIYELCVQHILIDDKKFHREISAESSHNLLTVA